MSETKKRRERRERQRSVDCNTCGELRKIVTASGEKISERLCLCERRARMSS